MYYKTRNGKPEYNIFHTSFLPFPWRHLPLDKDPYLGKNLYLFIGQCKLYHFVPFLTRFLADFEFRTSSSTEMAATTPLLVLSLNIKHLVRGGKRPIRSNSKPARKRVKTFRKRIGVCISHIYQ